MLALAMLLGSIPFGYMAVYFRSPGTARDSGCGVEAIRRAVGWPGLIAVVALNVAKGFVPVYLTMGVLHSIPIALLAGAIAIVSHCFPYWLVFRPMGKGGSVAVGALVGLLVQIAR
jgi:glycerol-3-phosphate acyltransferase PlsY